MKKIPTMLAYIRSCTYLDGFGEAVVEEKDT
jgi:hypothetical protein